MSNPGRKAGRLAIALIALGWALWLVWSVPLSGCSKGETIPLVGAGNVCDRPADPRWTTLSPLGDLLSPLDGVSTPDSQMCVVGSGGLALWKEGDQLFTRESTGTDRDLNSVALLGDGTLVAVGDAGTLSFRQGGVWQALQLAPGHDFSLVTAGAEQGGSDQAWAVGSGGLVATGGSSPHSWSIEPFPATADLTGAAARHDTLVVSGGGGCLFMRVVDQWHDLSDGPWGDNNVVSVLWPETGPLVALADSFYVLGPDGWRVPAREGYFNDYPLVRGKLGQGFLWYQEPNYLRYVEVDEEPWIFHPFYGSSQIESFIPGQGGDVLVLTIGGELLWQDREFYPRYEDPAGRMYLNLFQLADGTSGTWDDKGLLVPSQGRLVRALALSGEDHPRFGYTNLVVGHSLRDFYYIVGDDVLHYLDGVSTEVVDLDSSIRSAMLDGQGNLHLSDNFGLWRWDGTATTHLLPIDDDHRIFLFQKTAQGTLVAQCRGDVRYLDEAGWAPLPVPELFLAAEDTPGDLALHIWTGEMRTMLWRKGVGPLREWDFSPFDACPDLDFDGGWDSPLGLHIFSREPGLVLRQVGDPLDRNWDLVAGATSYQIMSIVVLPDGALLARCDSPEALLYYPSP